ncbi:MAG TPA: hypothetical protein PLC42_07530 [Parachlamydiaceae bacterium]|nr:hypothetical protein [Parachlamydiaceae bacterium]
MSSTYFNSESITPYLICPVSQKPLLKAVGIIPCNHKIEEIIAKKRFGRPMNGNWKTAKDLTCPVYNQTAKGYLIDAEMRKITAPVFHSEYPGERSLFEHVSGDFELLTSRFHFCREMSFKSETPNCLIHTLHFLGYSDGTIKIEINFNPCHTANIQNFFAGITNEVFFFPGEEEKGFYRTKSKKDLQVVFKIIKDNNTFPIKFLDKMQAIIEAWVE